MQRFTLYILLFSVQLFAQEEAGLPPEQAFADKYYDLATELKEVDVKEAMAALRKARYYAEKGKLYKTLVNAEYSLSELYEDLSLYDSASHHLQRALKLMDNHKLEEPYPSMLWGAKGNLFAQQGLPDSALYYHEKALASLRPSDEEGIVFGLMNYASVLVYANQYEQARKQYKRALQMALDSNYQNVLRTLIENMIVLDSKENERVSQSQLDTLLQIAKKANPVTRLTTYLNVASILVSMGELDCAAPFFDSLKTNGSLVSDPGGHFKLAYARFLQQSGAYPMAMQYLRQVWEKRDTNSHTVLLLKRMGEVYAQLNQPDSSTAYYQRAWELDQENYKGDIRGYIARSEASIKVIEARHQLEQSRLQQELLEAKIEKQRGWMIFLTVITILVGLSLFLYFRSLRKSKQLKETLLKHRLARITEMSLKLSQKNELIKSLELQFNQKTEGEDRALEQWKQEVSSNLKRVANTDKDWENLARYFEDQYQGFYQRLKAKHPNLTNNELRLCTLARMRMSIKEMSGVLSLSVDSVKSNRYRLRKKMGLSTQTDLSDYLSGF